MTTDYSKLDTAALVQAADALMAEITPGAWEWHKSYGRYVSLEATIGDDDVEDVISNAHRIAVSDADAAFIAAAPALVRALVTRLRESVEIPPAPKYKVGDLVQLNDWPGYPHDWKDGQIVMVKSMKYVPKKGVYMCRVTDGKSTERTMEGNLSPLERVENG